MHALASPSDDFPRHSIYMQLDGARAAEDEDGSEAVPPEVRLVPAEPSHSEFVYLRCLRAHTPRSQVFPCVTHQDGVALPSAVPALLPFAKHCLLTKY